MFRRDAWPFQAGTSSKRTMTTVMLSQPRPARPVSVLTRLQVPPRCAGVVAQQESKSLAQRPSKHELNAPSTRCRLQAVAKLLLQHWD